MPLHLSGSEGYYTVGTGVASGSSGRFVPDSGIFRCSFGAFEPSSYVDVGFVASGFVDPDYVE